MTINQYYLRALQADLEFKFLRQSLNFAIEIVKRARSASERSQCPLDL